MSCRTQLRATHGRETIPNETPEAVRITPGQRAYEEDVRRKPYYEDGAPRAAWDQIGTLAKMSWEKYPTPRDW